MERSSWIWLNNLFSALVLGPGLVWGGWRDHHSICGAFCNFTHSYSQCHRWCVAGKQLKKCTVCKHIWWECLDFCVWSFKLNPTNHAKLGCSTLKTAQEYKSTIWARSISTRFLSHYSQDRSCPIPLFLWLHVCPWEDVLSYLSSLTYAFNLCLLTFHSVASPEM